jgi:hypothetical protein
MRTRATERDAKLGASAKQVAEHASALARLEVELATLEIKRKIASLGRGIAFGLVAALLLLYALGFGLASAAAGIATQIPVWAALLVVTGVPRGAVDQAGSAAGSRPGDPRGEADERGAEARWQRVRAGTPSRFSATSRPSASASPARSTTCGAGSTG